MEARIDNPAITVPGAMDALASMAKAARRGGHVPTTTAVLVHLRVSQINGCAFCADMHARELREAGESDERLFTVATWHDAPWFTDAERAALALAEAATRLADRPEPVSDAVWDEAARHYDEPALSALVLEIAVINTWNRLNVTTRQVAGAGRQ
jgi:AhpD family alkylhydroperoxidase